MPYTIAAQIAYPDRLCVGFVGDGGFTMLMGEFATAVKYKLPIKIVIIKNNTLGQIKWEQMVFLGNPEYGCDLNPINFAEFARACGGEGFTIEDPEECGDILERALRTQRTGRDRSGGRSERTAHAAQSHCAAGRAFRRSAGKGHAGPPKKIMEDIFEDKIRELV